MEGGGCLAVMAQYHVPEEQNRKRRSARKHNLEGMVEAKEQVKNY